MKKRNNKDRYEKLSKPPKAYGFRIFLLILLIFCFCVGICVLCINAYVKSSTEDLIISAERASSLEDVDCILVLGCGVRDDGSPSDMLADRLTAAISLYEGGVAPKLLMSGDHGRVEYDEVNTMKSVAVDAGVPDSDVFMDHAGFSTYESLYRARDVFAAKKIVIVSQGYHLYRALYVAKALGLDAYGVSADLHSYFGQWTRELREIAARNKDFISAITKPKPTYLGEVIDISGDGNQTNDK